MPDFDLPPILIDTREPDPHPWQPYFDVPVIRGTLQTGDFSLPGCERMVAVERKTLSDLVACLTSSRGRFSRELERAQAIPHFWVIAEGSYTALRTGDYRSQMSPVAAFQSVVTLMTRYRIPFLMADSPATAAALCQSLLHKWFREHAKILDAAHLAARSLQRSA